MLSQLKNGVFEVGSWKQRRLQTSDRLKTLSDWRRKPDQPNKTGFNNLCQLNRLSLGIYLGILVTERKNADWPFCP